METISARAKYFLIVFLVLQAQFLLVEYCAELRPEHYLPMWIDQYIPFWSYAIWVYIFIYYGGWVVAFFGIKSIDIIRKGANALLYGAMMTVPIYLIYPIWAVRPDFGILTEGFSDKLVLILWQLDNAANVFPSQHAVFGFIIGMMMILAFPKWKWLVCVYLVLVCASIVLLKQHYVWDIMVGLPIGYFAYFLAFKREKLLI